MNLGELWAEMEASPTPAGEGRLLRRIHPEAVGDLYVGLLKPDDERMVILAVPGADCPAADKLPSTRGTRSGLGTPREDGSVPIELRLTDRAAREIFGALAADVASAAAAAPSHPEAVDAWIARLRRWQRLLQRLPPEGLSPESQRGLYCELWTLQQIVAPEIGDEAAVEAWTGPEPALHDFQHPRAALEVKSTAGAQHQVLRISSERQLDDTGTDALYLIHVSIDVRLGAGETLPKIVASARQAVAGTPAEARLEERLHDAGYLDVHAQRYPSSYTQRRVAAYRVVDGFPRIVEADLADGVGDVRYSVAVTECIDWERPLVEVRDTLRGTNG
jgi:hypothetical protein